MTHVSTRASIFLEDAEIISQVSFPGDQHILRVDAPRCAATAVPGSFSHIACDPAIPMRRPLSIMRTDADAGWVEFLYKPLGTGLDHLAKRVPGESVSVLGPIGNGFSPDPERPSILAIGGGVGIPPMVFLAERLRSDDRFSIVVAMGSEVPFPFEIDDDPAPQPGMPTAASRSVGLLEDWGVASRLASNAGYEGCFDGFVTELAREWLSSLTDDDRRQTQIVGCGPTPMLEATAKLAREFDLPCQLALEEFMACGVGGCAGCTVLVRTAEGSAMKRVCVDGPVFDAYEIYVE